MNLHRYTFGSSLPLLFMDYTSCGSLVTKTTTIIIYIGCNFPTCSKIRDTQMETFSPQKITSNSDILTFSFSFHEA